MKRKKEARKFLLGLILLLFNIDFFIDFFSGSIIEVFIK